MDRKKAANNTGMTFTDTDNNKNTTSSQGKVTPIKEPES